MVDGCRLGEAAYLLSIRSRRTKFANISGVTVRALESITHT